MRAFILKPARMRPVMSGRLICADVLDGLKDLPDNSVDLIMTSPPYAERRIKQYGGLSADKYNDWYMPIARDLKRILKPTGSYVMNMKEPTIDGQRSLYVFDLVIRHVKESGWKFIDTYVWHKQNTFPGIWPNRFANVWEPCYHFTKQAEIYFNQHANMEKPKKSTTDKTAYYRKLSEFGRTVPHMERKEPLPSGFNARNAGMKEYTEVRAKNFISIGVAGGKMPHGNHPAVFPVKLPAWFIRLFCPPGGVVLDPFVGSGTTCKAAEKLGRRWIGIDRKQEYIDLAKKRVGPQHEFLI